MLGLEGGFWIAILTWAGIAVLLSSLGVVLSVRESRGARKRLSVGGQSDRA